MSEYQYYEFLALDRPLAVQEMKQLRAISTRATITPTSFSNHYEWGDLKADPLHLLRDYFDVFVYVANWGTNRIAFRLPEGTIDAKVAKRYLVGDFNELGVVEHVVLIDMSNQDEYQEEFEDGSGWMASLAGVRTELMRGDLRPLYLAWLATAQDEILAEQELEPPVPPGLERLSPGQISLAGFQRVDPFLLAAASEGSGDAGGSTDGLDDWIATLPAREKDLWLSSVAKGDDVRVGASLMRRFLAERESQPSTPRRKVGDLMTDARKLRERHQQEQARLAEESRRREAEATARRREITLTELAGHQNEAWENVQSLIAERKQVTYLEAATLLLDLRVMAERAGEIAGFQTRMKDLAQSHARKPTLQEKLRKAGLLP